jgi:hypothetical protein
MLEALEGRSLLSTLFVNSSNTSGTQDGSQSNPFSTISAAISSAQADDTISIAAGTYAENVVVNKPLVLSGPGGTGSGAAVIAPVANDPGAGVNVVVEASNVTIEGLTINGTSSTLTGGQSFNNVSINAATGIANVDAVGNAYTISGLTVQNNVIENFTHFGVLGDGGDPSVATSLSTDNTISGNTIDNIPVVASAPIGTGQARGISIEDNFYATVTNNTLTRVATGIQAIFFETPSGASAATSISNNNVTYYDRGILLNTQDTGTPTFAVSGNTVKADPAADATNVGIDVDNVLHTTSVTLSGNDVTGAAVGIQLSFDSTSQGMAVSGGALIDNGVGLLLTNANPPSGFKTFGPSSAILTTVTITSSTQAGLEITDALGTTAAPVPVTLSADLTTTVSGSPHGAILSGPGAKLTEAGSPQVAINSGPSSSTTSSSATFAFTASDTITTPNDLVLAYTLDGGTPVAFSSTSSLTLSSLASGPHTLVIQATNQAGNVGKSSTYSWTISTSTTTVGSPSTPALASGSDTGVSHSDGITNDNTPTFTGTAPAGTTVTLYANSTMLGTTTAASSGGVWSFTPVSPLADGTYSITATATQGGSTSPASGSLTVVIDTTPPTVKFTSLPSSSSSSTTATFAFNASDSVTPAASLVLSYTLDGGAPVSLGSTGSLTLTGLSVGQHTLVVRAMDQAGNTGSSTDTWTVTSAPVVVSPPSTPALTAQSDTGVSHSDGITNDNTPTFTGTAPAGTTVTLYANSKKLGTTVARSTGSWSFAVTNPMADGTYSITATASDGSGHTSALSAAAKIVIDTAPPTVTMSATTMPYGIFDLGNNFVSISGRVSDPGSAITSASYIVRDSSGEVITSGWLKLAADGSYSALVLINSPIGIPGNGGAATITVTAQDVAGNAVGVTTPMPGQVTPGPPVLWAGPGGSSKTSWSLS